MNSTIARARKNYAQALEEDKQQLQDDIDCLREDLHDAAAYVALLEGAYRDFMQYQGTLEYERLKNEIVERIKRLLQSDDEPADKFEFRIWARAQGRGDAGERQQSPESGGQERGANNPTPPHPGPHRSHQEGSVVSAAGAKQERVALPVGSPAGESTAAVGAALSCEAPARMKKRTQHGIR